MSTEIFAQKNNMTDNQQNFNAGNSSTAEIDDYYAGCEAFINISDAPQGARKRSRKHIMTDKLFRHKCLHTVCVALAHMASGWRMSLVGPSLPDIRLIINEDISRASWIISAISLGGFAGCLGGGMLFDRFNKCLVFVGLTFLSTLASVTTTWCSTFSTMIAIHIITGMCIIGIDTVTYADVGLVWKQQSAPVMQAVAFSFSIGAMFGTLTTEPFLAKRQMQWPVKFNSSYNHSYAQNLLTIVSPDIDMMKTDFATKNNVTDAHMDNKSYVWTYGSTSIQYAFIIASLISLFASVSMLVQFCVFGNVHIKTKFDASQNDQNVDGKTRYSLNKKWRYIFLGISSGLLALASTSERLVSSYLMTFVLERLSWDKRAGANVTTIFWLAFTIGRLFCAVTVKNIKSTTVFAMSLGILFFGEIAMLVASQTVIHSLAWVSSVLFGLGMSALGGSIWAWVPVKVCPLTGKISGIMITTVIICSMVYPIILGNAMNDVSYDWFVYLAIIMTSCMAVLVTTAELLYRVLTTPK